MKMYIARDKDGKLHIFATKPEYNEKSEKWHPTPYSLEYMRVEGDYPEVTFGNSPMEVELKLVSNVQGE